MKRDENTVYLPLHSVMNTVSFAAEAHRHQRRKSGGAYINHPIRVATALANAGVGHPLVIMVALLHDVIEDTDCSYEEIEKHFGKNVANTVMELSDNKELTKPERKRLTIEHAPHLSRIAALVKIADVADNCNGILGEESPEGWSQERIDDYGEWGKKVAEAAFRALTSESDQKVARFLVSKSLIPTQLKDIS